MKYLFKPISPAPITPKLKTNIRNPIIKKTQDALNEIFKQLETNLNKNSSVIIFISKCIDFLDLQRKENPKNFVPHGAKHSYDVYMYAKKDLESLCIHTKLDLENKLRLPFNLIKFTLELSALLHDIGYPEQKRCGFQKCNHGPEGAKLFDTIANELTNIITIAGYSKNMALLIPATISKLIRFHGADKIDYKGIFSFQGKNDILSKKQEYLEGGHKLELPIFGRHFDRMSFKDNQLGMPCIIPKILEKSSLVSEPFFNFCIGKIRQYDNNDSTISRLTPTQRNVIAKICKSMSIMDINRIPIEDVTLPKVPLHTKSEKEFLLILSQREQRKYFLGQFATESLLIQQKAGSRIIINTQYNSQFENLFNTMLTRGEDDTIIPILEFFPKRIASSLEKQYLGDTLADVHCKHALKIRSKSVDHE